MNVEEFFTKLSYGELRNLSMGEEGIGVVGPEYQDQLITYTNSALTAIYSRIAHKRDYVRIQVKEGVHRYLLVLSNAVSQDANGFILDSASDPFKENVIKVLAITQEDNPATIKDESKELRILVHPAMGGIKMLTYNEIYIPNPMPDVTLSIEYQAQHDPLSLPTDLSEPIILAPMLHEALEMRVCAKVYSSMNGEANIGKAQVLQRRYEHLMLLTEQHDLLQESESSTTDKLHDKGFM